MIKKIIISSITLLVLDIAWLYLFMGSYASRMVLSIQGSQLKLNYLSAAMAYLLMIVGLQIFVIPNINPKRLLSSSLKYGFLFGVVLYGAVDFTSGSVLKKWDFQLTMTDVLWGGLAYFLTCLITFKIIEALNKKKGNKIVSEEQSLPSELYY